MIRNHVSSIEIDKDIQFNTRRQETGFELQIKLLLFLMCKIILGTFHIDTICIESCLKTYSLKVKIILQKAWDNSKSVENSDQIFPKLIGTPRECLSEIKILMKWYFH